MAAGVIPKDPMVTQRSCKVEAELSVALAAGCQAVQLHDQRTGGSGDIVVKSRSARLK